MRLLIVDDDPDDLFLLADAVRRQVPGAEVETVCGGEEGLAVAREAARAGRPPA
ncbi:MAG: hypothetical protein HY553_00595, partial [Elusimicrobia bacterium]|nr:hypothetical protein [Elusimicrobiota bacterium]